ncbi:hypothetical protein QQ045_021307 [Rhodiola kirilowii]
MANEENFVTVTFKEGPLGTNTEENALPPEADSGKPKSETEMPHQSSENQAGYDTGTLTLRHSDKKSPVTSELCGILHNEAQAKQAVPTSAEEEILTEQSFRGFRIDFPLQVILELGEMLPGPVTSLVVGCSSESETDKSPVKSPQHQPLADNFVQPDQLDSNCHDLPSVTAPPVVQHEAALLNGICDIEPQIQPEPVVEDEQPNYSNSPEEVISELEEMLSNHVASPGEVLSEVDESPDVDETNVPDGLSYPQFSLHQSAAINYICHSQLQSNGLKLPFVTTPLLRRNVMGNSFIRSIIHYPYPELLAARQDEYYPKSNLSNPQLPLIRRTSVPASSSAFGKPPGWFPSEQTGYTYQLPESWESCIPTGVQAAADRMRNAANSYSGIPPLAGQKRSRVTKPHLTDQVFSNGFPKFDMSGSDCPLATRPNQQDLGPQSLIPSFPPPFGFSGSPFPFPNFEVTQPSSDSEGYPSSIRHFEVNGTRQGSVPNLAPDIPSQFAQSQIVSNPTQNHINVHPPGHGNSLAPLNFNTRSRRVSLPIPNSLYDTRYEQLGLPIDPIMRAFMKYKQRNDDNNNLG